MDCYYCLEHGRKDTMHKTASGVWVCNWCGRTWKANSICTICHVTYTKQGSVNVCECNREQVRREQVMTIFPGKTWEQILAMDDLPF